MQFKRLNEVNGEATRRHRLCGADCSIAPPPHKNIGALARDGAKGGLLLYLAQGTS